MQAYRDYLACRLPKTQIILGIAALIDPPKMT
ncbi:hypothetical protein YPS_4456 [Yersinia pestis Pestoides A]|nr:hypothetical protein YPS_4456 [Yersinia pestis Pestoides A]